jgi:methionyl-tRNA synthetase
LFAPVLVLLIIWTIAWKGLALWRSARRGDSIWFVVLLLVNTLGILEIIYLLTAGKKKA